MPATLVRSVRFSAGHHYLRPEWSDEQNEQVFGASRHRHGHNFVLQVRVSGPVDPDSGFVVDLAQLDAVLESVVGPLNQRDLTDVVEDFRPGGRIPSTEALAMWFWEQLRDRIPGGARLTLVRVEEDETLAAEYAGP